jgi:hypothetical protein
VFNSTNKRAATVYGCGPVESSGPVFAGGAFGDMTGEYSYAIVSDNVAAVHLSDGSAVMPISSPRLPAGTRAYFTITRPLNGHRHSLPRLFDGAGQEIHQAQISRENAVEHLPQLAVNPRSPGTAGCAVHARPTPRLVPIAETVTIPVPWSRHQPGAFLACANARFRLDMTTLAVAVLVDATNSHRPAPQLPELQPDAAHPGLLTGQELGNLGFPQGSFVANFGGGQAFNAPTPHPFANHDVSARRAGPAWLIAEGGTPDQRAALLALLSIGA